MIWNLIIANKSVEKLLLIFIILMNMMD